MDILELLTAGIVAAPGIVFLLLGALWLLGWQPSEKAVAVITAITFVAEVCAVVALIAGMVVTGRTTVPVTLGSWFEAGSYSFPLVLLADRLSVPMMALTAVLVGLTGSFSKRYLHRERGFFRFFALLHLFAFGSLLIFAAGSFDLLLAGWELVGVTSMALVAYFFERRDPVRNAIRVFGAYRIADLGLLTGIFLLHHAGGGGEFSKLMPGDWGHSDQSTTLSGFAVTGIGLLLLLAASGKSAQAPFSGWLPRAMEGPTPSSAIFYGAISIHAGAYLLLRAQPIVMASAWTQAAVAIIGAGTALLGTLSHRTSTDAKGSLAYAAMTQVGVIFVEIAAGLHWVALVHICGHAVVRTMQFLRAPSMLHDHHHVHAAAGGHFAPVGRHFEALFPSGLRAGLYRMGLDRGFLDAMVDRWLLAPAFALSHLLEQMEPQRGDAGSAPKLETAGGQVDAD
jgi:NAD(P)H-quinone oxidoreductase subunit 5